MTTGSVPHVPLPVPPATSVPAAGASPTGGIGHGGIGHVRAGMPAVGHAAPFSWHGSPWDIAGTCLLNMALSILTLGIYGFWGRTEIRRRMWSSVRLFGEPLAYHGTPQELLRGFMAVLVVVLAPLFFVGVAVVVYFGDQSTMAGIYQILLFLVFYPILAALAYYRARRYRLARTSWRGVRGSMEGSSTGYAFFSWATACAYPLTLGWIAPYRAVSLQRRLVSETTLGNRPLVFTGGARVLYGRFATLWIGTIVLYFVIMSVVGFAIGQSFDPTNPTWWMRIRGRDYALIAGALFASLILWSLMSSFYYAKLYNHVAQSTLIGPVDPLHPPADPVRFDLDVSGGKIIWLFVTNALITYLSLYALKPVATARSLKYFTEHLRIVGPFDPAGIAQNTAVFDPAGEGLAQAFDLDAF